MVGKAYHIGEVIKMPQRCSNPWRREASEVVLFHHANACQYWCRAAGKASEQRGQSDGNSTGIRCGLLALVEHVTMFQFQASPSVFGTERLTQCEMCLTHRLIPSLRYSEHRENQKPYSTTVNARFVRAQVR